MDKPITLQEGRDQRKEIWSAPKLTSLKSTETLNSPVAAGNDGDFITSPG